MSEQQPCPECGKPLRLVPIGHAPRCLECVAIAYELWLKTALPAAPGHQKKSGEKQFLPLEKELC